MINKSAAWKKLYNYIHSQNFIDFIISLFGNYIKDNNCLVDPKKAKFMDHLESREWMSSVNVPEEIKKLKINPNNLFCSLIFFIGKVGYVVPIHQDWRHRLITILIYFSDADEQEMQGGNLHMYANEKEGLKKVKSVSPHKNTAVIMLDTNNSNHSVDEVKYLKGARKCVFITVSSRINIWPLSKNGSDKSTRNNLKTFLHKFLEILK